jgi:hypothetical protein
LLQQASNSNVRFGEVGIMSTPFVRMTSHSACSMSLIGGLMLALRQRIPAMGPIIMVKPGSSRAWQTNTNHSDDIMMSSLTFRN